MIVPMKRMTLIALLSDEDAILKELQRAGVMQIITPQNGEDSAAPEADAGERGAGNSLAQQRFIHDAHRPAGMPDSAASESQPTICDYLDNLRKRYLAAAELLRPHVKKPSLLAPLPEIEESILKDPETYVRADALCDRVEGISLEINENNSKLASVNSMIDSLTPWSSLDIKVEKIKHSKNIAVVCGFVPQRALEELKQLSLSVTTVREDRVCAVLLAYNRQDEQEVMNSARELGFTEYSFPKGIKGTPADALEDLLASRVAITADVADANERLAALGEGRSELLVAIDAATVEFERESARADMLMSDASFLVEAWVRSDEVEKVDAAIKSVTDAYFVEYDDPTEEEIPPSVVKNNKFFTPFESIVNLYSRPDPRGIDATVLMAPFYMLFFGMMLSDSGYGLVLFLACLLFQKLKKPRGALDGISASLMWCGLATVVCGLLFGTFFGLPWSAIFGEGSVFPVIDPLGEAITMLLLCCGLGLFHMIFGLCVKAYMCVKRGDTAAAIFDNLSWILMLVGIVGFAAAPSAYKAPFIVLAAIGTLLLVLFAGRNKKGFMKIGKGLGSLYDITGYLSDTVSYARVFAMGLVTGAMGEVFNLLGGMLAQMGGDNIVIKAVGIIFAMVVLVVLHAFSLFINTLGSFAHTARLQYVEYFGKFYETGGRAFLPLAYKTKYVSVKRDV